MILIVTALKLEAEPLIAYYHLKRDMTIHAYPVYGNADMRLIIGGVGKVRSAMAAAFLLSGSPDAKQDILCNIGFCGTGSRSVKPGTMIAVWKVTDMDTQRDYYPDVFWGQDLPGAVLCCYARPVRRTDIATQDSASFYCDMESAGIMEAAARFLDAHQVALLKITSDFLTPDQLDKTALQQLLADRLPEIVRIIQSWRNLAGAANRDSLAGERNLLNQLSGNHHFTVAMKHLLDDAVRKSFINGKNPVAILEQAAGTSSASKREGKILFEQLRQQLRS
ncbi:MAG: nucleoside phosphorylase [Clostridiaceae bacterium]|nr:nucleoside phosphorylase [Clostridiaceae bacterium]